MKSRCIPVRYAEFITYLLKEKRYKEIELLGVGQAISTLLHVSSLVGEYIEFLKRLSTFAFKPCEYCGEN